MKDFWLQINLLGAASLGIILAFVGDLVRLLHEHERGGKPLTIRAVPGSALRGLLMGVIATATSVYLRDNYSFPELAGGALGGILGYAGPTVLVVWAKIVLERLSILQKPKGGKDDDA